MSQDGNHILLSLIFTYKLIFIKLAFNGPSCLGAILDLKRVILPPALKSYDDLKGVANKAVGGRKRFWGISNIQKMGFFLEVSQALQLMLDGNDYY